MDKSEPTLVPEWLKSSGSVSGNGTSITPLASSLLRPDDHLKSKVARKSSLLNYDQNLKRPYVSERRTSAYFRRSSSTNGSDKSRTYSNYCRNQHDRDWDGDIFESSRKDRSIPGDSGRLDYSDPMRNNILNGIDSKSLRRSQSTISDQRGETWPREVETGLKYAYKVNGSDVNHMPANGLLHKASFQRDFPSLGIEEKLAATEIKRLPSPVLIPTIHNFPVASSDMIGCDKWTSALAEVPGVVRSSEVGSLFAKAAAPSFPSLSSSILTGPSMAETVAHGSPRVYTPQLSAETQRQELAIKQSRQLIPVTPSLPKALVFNLPEQQKNKNMQPLLVHTPRGGSMKPDLSKACSIGKLQVLKPVWDRNGVPLAAKDNSSSGSARKASGSVADACQSVVGSSSMRAPTSHCGHTAAERKHVLPLLEQRAVTQSQTQSRSDFFSLMRKKSISNSSSSPESIHVTSPSDKFSEGGNITDPVTHQSGGDMVLNKINGVDSSENGDVGHSEAGSCIRHEYLNSGKNGSTCNSIFFSEEEEAAFLRSLGWEENTEEAGLTDEEINAFYRDVSHVSNKAINSTSTPNGFSCFEETQNMMIKIRRRSFMQSHHGRFHEMTRFHWHGSISSGLMSSSSTCSPSLSLCAPSVAL